MSVSYRDRAIAAGEVALFKGQEFRVSNETSNRPRC
jgi:hypothetical protein